MSKTDVTMKRRFTRTPTMESLISDGAPLRAIPTYHALSDHASYKTGKTHVSIKTIARILKVHRRTVERHLTALEEAGIIKRQHQRRFRGRFSSCLCVIISFAFFTVRHRKRHSKRRPIKDERNDYVSTPKSPMTKEEIRAADRARRWEGYEHLRDA